MRKKRLLSALMVLAMAISLVPVQVLAAFDDGSWGYYFYNTTDRSLSEEVQVYYSTDGETLTPLAHGDTAFVSSSDIQWDRVNAIVFYVSITEDAENAGVAFTTDNQEGTLNTISKNGAQATISGTTNNTIGGTNFNTATNLAYDSHGCKYAFSTASLTGLSTVGGTISVGSRFGWICRRNGIASPTIRTSRGRIRSSIKP